MQRPGRAINPYDVVLKQLDETAERIGVGKDILEILKHPRRILIVSVPIRMDDGSVGLHRVSGSAQQGEGAL